MPATNNQFTIINASKLVEFIESSEDYQSVDYLTICVFFNRHKVLEKSRSDVWNDSVINSVYFKPLAIYLRKRQSAVEVDLDLLTQEFGNYCFAFNKSKDRQLDTAHEVNMLEICPRKQSYEKFQFYPSRIHYYDNYYLTVASLAHKSKDDEVFTFRKRSNWFDTSEDEDEAIANL